MQPTSYNLQTGAIITKARNGLSDKLSYIPNCILTARYTTYKYYTTEIWSCFKRGHRFQAARNWLSGHCFTPVPFDGNYIPIYDKSMQKEMTRNTIIKHYTNEKRPALKWKH